MARKARSTASSDGRFAQAPAGARPERRRGGRAMNEPTAFARWEPFEMKQSTKATARLLFAASFCCALAFCAGLGRAEEAKPTAKLIKLAVFDLELDDFSAGGPLAGESAEETARLLRVTALAREQLAKSGLFELVDTSASSDENVKAHWLRKCNGCEADIARALGADMSFLGFFRKISVMEQNLEFRIRDSRTGELMNVSQTDYRGETDESWSRAIVWLIRHGLVEPELARRARETAR